MLCGLPSVTLKGTKADYESIIRRLDGICSLELGPEVEKFVSKIRPIIKKFVAAFNEGPNSVDEDFWSHICSHRSLGSGQEEISGWITAFCVWDQKGKWQGDLKAFKYVLEGQTYPVLSGRCIPSGWCEVDVVVKDFSGDHDCTLLAGLVGSRVSTSHGANSLQNDTLQPEPHWFIFEKKEARSKKRSDSLSSTLNRTSLSSTSSRTSLSSF